MRFCFHLAESWPVLAWLARCERQSDIVHVIHGARVELKGDWFCEAVWDRPYCAGEFDSTDLAFGSGGRLRDGSVTFVSSGSTVDRLQSLQAGRVLLVSNSLPCLLAVAGGHVDPAYPHYFRDFASIRLGLSRYRPTFPTSAGVARLVYFRNLTWNGTEVRETEKPVQTRDFRSFERYRGFLQTALQRLAENLAAPERRFPYRYLGTISSGYDSPMVAVIGRNAGLREVISFDRSREADGDSGHEIASRLSLGLTLIARDEWRSAGGPFAEVPFLAADAKGEDVFFKSAEEHLKGAVLLTGFHGDKIWGKNAKDLGPDLARGDQSGLSLTEFRLHAGFIHCPVPFMGVRQIGDVNRLSRSPTLARWDVPGEYSRPICRRVVEEAGIPRTAFGVRKKAASVLFFNGSTFLNPDTLAEYLAWLEANADAWRRAGCEPPAATPGRHESALQSAVARLSRLIDAVAPERVARSVNGWAEREPLFRWVFPWALDRARAVYARTPQLS